MSLRNISAAELKRVTRVCERLHYSNSNEPFANHLYVVLQEALPSIHFMSIHFSLSPVTVKQILNQTLPGYEGFMRYMHQHPGIQCYCAANQSVGSLLTEFAPAAYRKTELYNEVYRPVNIEDQVWLGVGDRKELIALSYSRDTAYTERDQQLLSMIQPHANIAWKNWKRIRSLENRLREQNTPTIASEQQTRHASAMQASIQSLTRRQREVVERVAVGKTNLEIAAELQISPRTVAKHVEHIFTALNIHTRTALAYASAISAVPPM